MKTARFFATSATILAVSASLAIAGTFTKGVVKKVDPGTGKVTIIHEELVDLDMPAMTMVFRLADPAMMDRLTEGNEVEFVADRVNGKLTVVELK